MKKIKYLAMATLASIFILNSSVVVAKNNEKINFAKTEKTLKVSNKTSQKNTAVVQTRKVYYINGRPYSTKANGTKHYNKVGKASYYHNMFNGRRTANGEIFSNAKMTAASRTLPMNTWLLVTNPRNNRKVVVRINDRGPYVHPRILDLSRAAAAEIGMIRSGVATVKIEQLHPVKK